MGAKWRRGNFVSVEEFRLLRDDLRGDGVWKRRTQITITDANAARQIARDLEAFASFLEAEERKNEPSGGGENSSPNEPDNFRSDETSAEQPLFADILKVRNRPSAGNSSKEATRTEGGSS